MIHIITLSNAVQEECKSLHGIIRIAKEKATTNNSVNLTPLALNM